MSAENQDLQRLIRRMADAGAFATFARSFVESATYTPEYYGGTTAGVTTYAASGQVGSYTRLGDLCWFSARVEWTAATGTGEARITLPFTNTSAAAAIAPAYPVNVAWTGDFLIAQIPAGASYMNFRGPTTTTAGVVNVEAAGVLLVSGIYQIAS